MMIPKRPFPAEAQPRSPLPQPGVVLPVVLALLVQAVVSMSTVAVPVFMPVATGGTLFFTFQGILLGLPAFSLVVETTGSYPLGFVIVAVATLACGVVLSFSRTPR